MPIKKNKKTTKKTTKKAARRPVSVNRSFLLKLADQIYNPKTRSFLRLCDGTLQNGPDPTDKSRPMHCGLGELYFAMTGNQPEFDSVNEDDVVNLAVELSPLNGLREAAKKEKEEELEYAEEMIRGLQLPDDVKDNLLTTLDESKPDPYADEPDDDLEARFRDVLDDIPSANDDGCGDHGDGGSCTIAEYRKRSMRVASKLREAAKILPR